MLTWVVDKSFVPNRDADGGGAVLTSVDATAARAPRGQQGAIRPVRRIEPLCLPSKKSNQTVIYCCGSVDRLTTWTSSLTLNPDGVGASLRRRTGWARSHTITLEPRWS